MEATIQKSSKFGARTSKGRLLLYSILVGSFVCIAISNATSSWILKDWFKDDIFGDEYRGLWRICYDRKNRVIATSCVEKSGDVFVNNIRSSMCLAFLLYAIVLGYVIAMQFRADLSLRYIGFVLIISSMCALHGLLMFIATQEIPRAHLLYEVSYGYSFTFGWIGMLGTFIAGAVLISLPKYTDYSIIPQSER